MKILLSQLYKNFFVLVLFLSFLSIQSFAQDSFEIEDPTQNPPKEYEIADVEVIGNELTNESFIISASSLRPGSKITYPGEEIGDGIKRLYQSGLFSDVQVLISEKSLNTISLIIQVTEQPRLLEYKIEGVKRSQRKDLEDLIKLIPGTAITDASKAQAINTIKEFYREKGYWYTKIETKTRSSEKSQDRKVLIFEIDPGERLEVKEINFHGNKSFSDRKLEKKIKPLKEDGRFKIFGKKVFKQEDFDEGKEKVLNFYSENGYRDVRIISDSVYTFKYGRNDKKTGIKVDVFIEEGPQYKVRNITWEGNTVYTDEQLTEAFDFRKGDIFNEKKYNEQLSFSQDGSDINSLYQNIGYLFFQINPRIEIVGEDSLDLHFELFEDEVATINEVSFTGNTKTHDDVVRRTLRTIPGNTYSRQAIIRTVRELSTIGYFVPEKIIPDVVPNPQNRTVDITFNLEESQSTDNFEFSGGYGGRSIGAILSARVNFNNFSLQRAFNGGWNPIPSGDGQRVSLGVQVTGTGFQSYNVGFTEPWLGGKPTSLGVNFQYSIFNVSGSNEREQLFSSSVTVGKRLKWPDDFFSTRTTVNYQLYDISNASTFLAEGSSSVISFKQELERNSFDNFISPTRGSRFLLSGEIAPPMPGFSEFYKIKTGYQYHVPITGKLVLTNSVDYGYIGYLTEDKRADIQRFFVGGTQLQQRQSFLNDNIDLRGFPGGREGTIAPVVEGFQVGGRIFSKYSTELRYPAISNQQLQLIPYIFADAGNAFLDFQDFDPFNVKRAVGFGARIFLPILGLVDLSYGYRLDGIPTATGVSAGQWEFLFNIGSPFQ